jgi:hypothetical protein
MLIFDHTGAGGDESALKELLWRVCGHLLPATVIAALLAAWAASAAADSAEARCEVYAKGSDKMQTMVPCTFSQRQGCITIAREDGVTYSLSPAGDAAFGTCPAGILRMDSAQASIVIQSRSGAQFTVNFMTDYVNAAVGEVTAALNGDLWTVTRDNGEVYQVPLAAINGG